MDPRIRRHNPKVSVKDVLMAVHCTLYMPKLKSLPVVPRSSGEMTMTATVLLRYLCYLSLASECK